MAGPFRCTAAWETVFKGIAQTVEILLCAEDPTERGFP
uniref:Uncharacterized protein n=1 Tax=Nymphaea colorata TaxID=210225 RepID=A0A5K0WPK2_9MAGN